MGMPCGQKLVIQQALGWQEAPWDGGGGRWQVSVDLEPWEYGTEAVT